MTRKTVDRIVYVFALYMLLGASLMSGYFLADYFMYSGYSMLFYLFILIVAYAWPWLALEWVYIYIVDFITICVLGTYFIDEINELGEWMLYAKIGWVLANIILVIAIAYATTTEQEEEEKVENPEENYYTYNTRGLQMNFKDEIKHHEDESLWTTSSGSRSSSKGSNKSKGFSWFSGGNSHSDYRKGREDGWRDSYIYGDSHKFDTGRAGGSKSYNDGYYDGYLDGDD